MEIIIGKTAGFCGGVSSAIQNAEKDLNKYKKVYCLGELIHNEEVINKLKEKGMIIINKIEEAEEKVIIRAHGAEKSIYEKAKKLNIELLDYTCKKVLLIHDLVEEHAKNGYYIILTGDKKHPEVIGTYSFCGEYKNIITKTEDIEDVITDIKKSKKEKILVVSQTTFNSFKFDEIVENLKNKLDKSTELKIEKTICNATNIRQNETVEISRTVDLMIIIGGKNSSNTHKLYEISKKHCNNVIIIQTYKDLDKQYVNNFEKIGIMAGASTPKESINGVINHIKN